jgi:hypothetical protein
MGEEKLRIDRSRLKAWYESFSPLRLSATPDRSSRYSQQLIWIKLHVVIAVRQLRQAPSASDVGGV